MKIKINCLTCGKKIETEHYLVRTKRYCSNECKYKQMSLRQTGKSYEDILGKEKAIELKKKKSIIFKEVWKNNPSFKNKRYSENSRKALISFNKSRKGKSLAEVFGKEKADELIKNNPMLKKGNPAWNKNMKGYHNSGTITKERRAKMIFPIKDTSIEIKIQNFLNELGIEYYAHRYMNEITHAYQCDIFIPSMNKVIECDGNYWHSYPTGTELDNIRTKELIEKGFKVLRLWEFEIKEMDINSFKNKLYGNSTS